MLTTSKLPKKINEFSQIAQQNKQDISELKGKLTTSSNDVSSKISEAESRLQAKLDKKADEEEVSNLHSKTSSDIKDIQSTISSYDANIEQMKHDVEMAKPANAMLDLDGYESAIDPDINTLVNRVVREEIGTITDENKMTEEQKQGVASFKKQKEVHVYRTVEEKPVSIEVNKNNVLDVVRYLLKNAHQHIVKIEETYNCDCDCSYESHSKKNDNAVILDGVTSLDGATSNDVNSILNINIDGIHIDGSSMKSDVFLPPNDVYDFNNASISLKDGKDVVDIYIDDAETLKMDTAIILLDTSHCRFIRYEKDLYLPKINYHLAMSNGIILQGKGELEFNPYDTGLVMRFKTAEKLSFHAIDWKPDGTLLKLIH